MGMQALLKDLARIKRMLFVVGGDGCVSEMYSSGKSEPSFHGEWGTMESGDWHFHIHMSKVKIAQFVEAEDHGAPMVYYVRFASSDDDNLLRCYFPNPYMDDSEKLSEFQPFKLKVFEDLRDQYVGQPGITFVRRPKNP